MSSIVHLTMQGFRGAKGPVDYDLSKNTVLVGNNASGKSTVLHAVRSAMLGTVPESCINTGMTDAVALVKLDDGTEIKTVASEKTTAHYLNGKKFAKKDVSESRGKVLHLSPEIAEILFRDGQYALDLEPEKFSKLIGSVLPKGATLDDLITGLKITPEEEKVLRGICAEKEIDFAVIAALFKTLSGQFTELNRDIDATNTKAEVMLGSSSGRPVELLKKRQNEIISSLKEIQDYEKAQKDYEEAKARFEKRLSEIKALKETLSAKPAAVPEGEIEVAYQSISQLNGKITEETKLIATMEQTVETCQKTLDALRSSVCPFSKELVCTTDKSSAIAMQEKVIRDNTSMINMRREKLTVLRTQLEQSEKRVQELRARERELMKFAQDEERLRQLCAERLEPPMPPEAKTVGSEEILREDLRKISDEISSASRVEEAAKLKERAKALESERAVVERLRKRLAPKGEAYNYILDRVCGLLNKQMNTIATELSSGREYEFRLSETGMTLYGKKIGDPGMIPVKDMSTGERFIAHLLLNTLINSICGLPFIVLDNIDCLDAGNLEKVLTLITSPAYESKFANVILSGVNHTDTMTVINKFASARTDFKVLELA